MAEDKNKILSLSEKMVLVRNSINKINKDKTSEKLDYKFATLNDIYREILPQLNNLGVDFRIMNEKPTIKSGDENVYITTFNIEKQSYKQTYSVKMYIYEADLTIRWVNMENVNDFEEATIHIVAQNTDSAKAKGAALTYGLKYYLFNRFLIDLGEIDPDYHDNTVTNKIEKSGAITKEKAEKLYKIASESNISEAKLNSRILEVYNKSNAYQLSDEEYEFIISSFQKA